MSSLRFALIGAALVALVAPASAQTQPPTSPTADTGSPKLVFEREAYAYPGAAGRRDPFMPLTGANETGPLFQDLQLRMILYSAASPARSVASVVDANRKVYRVKRGDVVGNATVLDVGPRRVLFSVVDFGVRRQEVLQLKPTNREGA
jgi:hypothetical protein